MRRCNTEGSTGDGPTRRSGRHRGTGFVTPSRILCYGLAATALAAPLFAQEAPTFRVRYFANVSPLSSSDSYINITNTGVNGTSLESGTSANLAGSICANVYVFSPDEQMVSCCSCAVTPNGLVSLSAKADLLSNLLTPAVPGSIVVALVATLPVGGSCSNSSAATRTPVEGLEAWATTSHARAVGDAPSAMTETVFTPAFLSTGMHSRLTQLCTLIQANGSGYGVCQSCRLGGLGAARR